MKQISYLKYNPSENITALIVTPITYKECLHCRQNYFK